MDRRSVGTDESAADDALERRTIRKVTLRLLPLMIVMYLINNIDRFNVSFAALTMNASLGLSALSYGWGAGVFFIAYFMFEAPSNLIMERVGARLWMTRIMVTWALVSGLTAFVHSQTGFVANRFLLGVAEAGFVPGMQLYITYWFPPRYRARAVALFLLAAPLSFAIAGVLSVPILRLDGLLGVAGWRWMFICEAVPSMALALVVWVTLTDTPAQAKWLAPEEREWLQAQCARPVRHAHPLAQIRASLTRRLALLASIYFTRTTAVYGISLFLPLIVKGMGLSNAQTGLVSSVPFLVATAGAVIWGFSSDHFNERHWHTIGTMLITVVGFVWAGWAGASLWALIGITIAATGLYAQAGCFWTIPPLMLPPAAAAVGIALINGLGNLGGFIGPYILGWTEDATHSYALGLYLMAGFAGLSALLGVALSRLNWTLEPDQSSNAV